MADGLFSLIITSLVIYEGEQRALVNSLGLYKLLMLQRNYSFAFQSTMGVLFSLNKENIFYIHSIKHMYRSVMAMHLYTVLRHENLNIENNTSYTEVNIYIAAIALEFL